MYILYIHLNDSQTRISQSAQQTLTSRRSTHTKLKRKLENCVCLLVGVMKPSLCYLQPLQQLLQALCVILACTGICRGCCRCSTSGNRSCRKMVLCASCGKNSRKVKSIMCIIYCSNNYNVLSIYTISSLLCNTRLCVGTLIMATSSAINKR